MRTFVSRTKFRGFASGSESGCSQLKLLFLANTTAIPIISYNPCFLLWFGYFAYWNLIIPAEANREAYTQLQHPKSWASYSGYPVVWKPIQMSKRYIMASILVYFFKHSKNPYNPTSVAIKQYPVSPTIRLKHHKNVYFELVTFFPRDGGFW